MESIVSGKYLSACYNMLELILVDCMYHYFNAYDMINDTRVMLKIPKDEKGFRDLVYEWDYTQTMLKSEPIEDEIALIPQCIIHDIEN